MLTGISKYLIMLSIIMVSVVCGVFYKFQNSEKRMGGSISLPKLVWLGFAIFLYLFFSPIITLNGNTPLVFKYVIGTFSILIWLRAIVEGWLLYKSKHWKPMMGISHNLMCVAVMTAQYFLLLRESNGRVEWFILITVLIMFCLLLDTYYAVSFKKLVGEVTVGENAVWFASNEDNKFQAINRVTTFWNCILYGAFSLLLWKGFNL